ERGPGASRRRGRLPALRGARAAALARDAGGVLARPGGVRGVPGPLLRRPGVGVGRGGPPGHPLVDGRHGEPPRAGAHLGGAQALGGAVVLPLPARGGAGGGQPRAHRAHPQEGAPPPRLPHARADGGGVPRRRGAGGGGRLPGAAQPGHRGALLRHRHAAGRAAGHGPRQPGPGERPRAGAGEGAQGAHRAAGALGHARAAHLLRSARAGDGGGDTPRPARRVRGADGAAHHRAPDPEHRRTVPQRDRRRRGALHPLPPPLLRDPPAGRGRGPAGGEGAARPRQPEHHADLHAHLQGAAEAGVPAGAPAGV
ncbi:MAG: Site-specific tyrosine recombinase XerC, partial [uncultured Gemmatimonadetes bacterium]